MDPIESKSQERKAQVVAVVEDLFFGTKVADAVQRAGADIVFVTTHDALWQRLAKLPSLLIFDLTYSKLDPLTQIRQLKADNRYEHIPIIGYLPHVREDLRVEAMAAGCLHVFPRSLFSSRIDEIVKAALNGQ